jgi:hypothetical protein
MKCIICYNTTNGKNTLRTHMPIKPFYHCKNVWGESK